MTTLAQSFGASASLTVNTTAWAQAVTISTNALNVSGVSPVPDDIMLTVSFAVPAGTPADSKAVNVWIAPSEDGTHYPDNDQYSGTNNTQTTLRSPSNFLGPFVVAAGTASITAYGVLPSLRTLCGGILPREFGVILENQSGLTLTSPAVTYTPVNFTNS